MLAWSWFSSIFAPVALVRMHLPVDSAFGVGKSVGMV